jgi:hypothetical protein
VFLSIVASSFTRGSRKDKHKSGAKDKHKTSKVDDATMGIEQLLKKENFFKMDDLMPLIVCSFIAKIMQFR